MFIKYYAWLYSFQVFYFLKVLIFSILHTRQNCDIIDCKYKLHAPLQFIFYSHSHIRTYYLLCFKKQHASISHISLNYYCRLSRKFFFFWTFIYIFLYVPFIMHVYIPFVYYFLPDSLYCTLRASTAIFKKFVNLSSL